MTEDELHMNTCYELAAAAQALGNPAAGCVIVKDGEVLAAAGEASVSKADITCHSEIEAIREAVKKAGNDLSACTLYTTHEPCVMCSYPIRYYGVGRLVIDAPVHFFGGAGPQFPLLTTLNVPAHWPPPPQISWYPRQPPVSHC